MPWRESEQKEKQATRQQTVMTIPAAKRVRLPLPPETTVRGNHVNSERTAIESRVARIKARVAELTGNMEGVR